MTKSVKLILMIGLFLAPALSIGLCTYSFALEEKLQQFTLSNGIEVYVKEDSARKVATLQVWVMVGSADEQESEKGISHLIEHMAFKGTERRGVGKIAAEVEALGGETNAFTSWDKTVFYVTVPSEAVLAGLDILTDAVLRPSIDPVELDKEKQVVIEEILEGEERPERKAFKRLFHTAYVSSPYKYPVIGFKETVEKFTRDDIMRFREKWYKPENIFILLVGDVDASAVQPELERMTADLKPTGFFRPRRPQEPVQTEVRAALERDRNARETRLNLGFHIPSVMGNDVNALDLCADLLGPRESARLVRVLKKEKKLVHSIGAYAATPREPGLMVIWATLDSSNLEAAVQAIMEELTLLAKEPPSEEELNRAKIHIESQHVYARDTVEGTAQSIGSFKADLGDAAYEEKYLKLNEAVTPQDISRVVRTYLTPPNVTVTVLMPQEESPDASVDKLVDIIKSFGQSPQSLAEEKALATQPVTKTLPNGIRVVLVPDMSSPVVAIKVAFLGGKRFETKEEEGIMNFIAQMLTKGTTKMNEQEIAQKVEDMGGRLKGFSGNDSFGFSGTFFSRYLDEGLSLMAHLYADPAFPEDKVERERTLILNRIKTEADRPVQYAIKMLNGTLFTRHPYGFDKEGTLATVSGFTPEDLRTAYRRFAVPSNMVITVVGDMGTDKTMKSIERLFGAFPPGKPDIPSVLSEEPIQQTRQKEVRIPRAKAHLAIGFRGTTLANEDRYPLEVLNNILAGQGGRLFLELRDKESLAYIVTSFIRPGMDPGVFGFYIACDVPKVDKAREGLLREINRVRTEPPSQQELDRAINNFVGNHLISLQSAWARAENTALNTLYGLGYDFDSQYIKKIRAVTREDVLKVAKKYLNIEHGAVVKILPEEKNP